MQTFSPFPLRARGAFEIFDAAIKLYKQYFWILLGWSAIVTGVSLFGSIMPLGGFAGFFLTPLAMGAVVCCVAASVRGQSVEFGQCWRFTQSRYWPMLGMHLLGSIIGFLVIGVFTAAIVGIIAGGVYLFQSSPFAVQLTMSILGFVILGAICTIVWTVFFSWVSLIPIVVCMEEDKKGTMALGRAYDILRGHWLRITALMALVGLGMLAVLGILGGAVALIVGVGSLGDMMQGNGNGAIGMVLAVIAMGLGWTMVAIVCTPLYYLILTVFYLDVRVRQEALDLEWTAHASMPVDTAGATAPGGIGATPGFIPTAEGSTTSYSTPDYLASELSPIQPSPSPFEPLPTQFSPTNSSPSQPSPFQVPEAPQPSSPYGTQILSEESNPFVPVGPESQPDVSPAPSFPPGASLEPTPDHPLEPPAEPERPVPRPPTAW